jgi:hypothetical protein
MTAITTPELPSLSRLLRATALAFVVAAVLLILIVLPAEYGVDPTGIGRRLGLTRLAAADTHEQPAAIPAGRLAAAIERPASFRVDEVGLTLASGEGAEIKATMREGDRFVYSWSTHGGAVDFDMHGEPAVRKGDEYSSYSKKDGETGSHGSFEAPFDGTHGWFWQNLGADPVTITLKTSGFYDRIGKP